MTVRTAVVTGITGQDGHYLTELLLAEGVRVHGITRSLAHAAEVRPEVTMYEAALTRTDAVAALFDDIEPDMVFHLAGMSSVAASWADPVQATEVNALTTAAILDACLRTQDRTGKQITVVNASSQEIFAGSPGGVDTETTSVAPTSPYGAGKALGHHLCQIYRARGLQAANAILYSHESPRRPERFVTRKITKAVARIAAGRQAGLTLGDVSVQRDWGWAPDYVDAMYAMAVRGVGDDYVVATGQAHSIADFVAIAFAAAGISDWQHRVVTDESLIRPADRPAMVGDATKAWDLLNWKPTKSFHEIVVSMVDSDLLQERDA